MLKALFSNRLFLGALAFFVFCVSGSLLYMQHVSKQSARELAETQERIKELTEKPTSNPTAEVPEGDTSQDGHFHADGTLHAGAHDSNENPSRSSQPPLAFSGERIVTKAEEAEWQKYWADMGLEPPPSGHGYQWDENGKVSLFQYNVPEFEVKWSEKETPGQDYYKLSDEEWRQHRALRHIISQTPLELTPEQTRQVTLEGKPFPTVTYAPGVVELAKERLADLDRKASGRTPKVSTTVSWNREPTKKELEDIERKEYEMLKSLEKPRRPSPGPWDENFIAATLKELETEAQRR